ncbi:YlbF family regulator [Staphylococcus simulans]|uniref:YlbF family regulator n=1 Tax=Staphylococcus simulans TaxID=1286 RepID=UPI000D046892|nr:YlbF family regulator [Staphylococcus simulans]
MINTEVIDVLDHVDAVSDMILQSDIYHAYRLARQEMNEDETAQAHYQTFMKNKVQYDEVMRFGKYHPDYQTVSRATRKSKRDYEMVPSVMAYKQKEVELQNLIDEVITIIATSISDNVKIEVGNPFFRTDMHGCSTGGSCQCQVHA